MKTTRAVPRPTRAATSRAGSERICELPANRGDNAAASLGRDGGGAPQRIGVRIFVVRAIAWVAERDAAIAANTGSAGGQPCEPLVAASWEAVRRTVRLARDLIFVAHLLELVPKKEGVSTNVFQLRSAVRERCSVGHDDRRAVDDVDVAPAGAMFRLKIVAEIERRAVCCAAATTFPAAGVVVVVVAAAVVVVVVVGGTFDVALRKVVVGAAADSGASSHAVDVVLVESSSPTFWPNAKSRLKSSPPDAIAAAQNFTTSQIQRHLFSGTGKTCPPS